MRILQANGVINMNKLIQTLANHFDLLEAKQLDNSIDELIDCIYYSVM